MMDRPIIFSAAMVRALLDGRKTQTRRLATSPLRRCEVGDRLWVREAWSGIFWSPEDIDGPTREFWETPKIERTKDLSSGVFYMLDEEAKPGDLRFVPEGQWTPSIHMPRWASRLTLIVEGVKIEPLQEIGREDAISEGLIHKAGVIEPDWWMLPEPHHQGSFLSPVAAYRWLWNDLHTAEGERWDDGPTVVALSFRVVRANIDQVPA